ncbi:MAG: 2-hydroxychromene-2-carboxylate isomerase [Gammaproteobacteria bacterium]|nr:2-hydroxychromene-2-carboxylate isomerase [Gammaproteobacteria bacterium]MBU3996626.1 2-hydroxychromene-2-carboxylate isomerase [Gammaproteobacteria bacterium]MBU4017759.1 2-hydroxychromene-2-carboxylate isomerase [Gammaproteobacteria bacterium]MBU4081202.1 2-hydroxychromene-2-carboxylate isomerase [Gammaproteobacteria bacterium]MBU4171550.1 2-hydroxychromene-2-carboxylate isomerase [Gammaproteobacteria bacterium]
MIEFFFDCASPWTYLAFHNLQPLAAELNEPVHWRPVLVGGIFNAVNPSVYAMRDNPVPIKWAYMLKDLQDWAREEDISQDEVLLKLCSQVGVDADAFLAGIAQPAIKAQLKANTEEVVARGGFGSPTLFFGDDMYFGNDRLPLLRAAILRRYAAAS